MEMDLEQSTSSVGGELTVKQEPVELKPLIIPKQEIEYITVEVEPLVKAEEHLPLKQEIEYISVKEEPPCLEKWEPDSSQDPLSITKEECSPPEYYLGPSTSSVSKTEISTSSASKTEISTSSASKTEISTSSVSKTEIEEDEGEDAGGDDWEEVKHEVEPTSDDSEPESAILASDGDNKSADGSDKLVTIQEPYCDNDCGVSRQWYWCSICKKTFAQFEELREHRQERCHETLHSYSGSHETFTSNKKSKKSKAHSHLHASEPQTTCDVCHERFRFKYHLKQHLSRTTSNGIIKCYLCGRSYKNNCALETHLKGHIFGHLRHPYSCDICKKTFKRKANFKQHSLLHSDFPTFSCDVCNMKFKSIRNLKRHSYVHTGNEQS